MGLVTASLSWVPARSVFDRSNVRRRQIAIGAVSLLAVFILGSMIWSVVRDVFLDDGPVQGPSITPSPTSPPAAGRQPAPRRHPPAMEARLRQLLYRWRYRRWRICWRARCPASWRFAPMLAAGRDYIVHEEGWVITNAHVVGGQRASSHQAGDGRRLLRDGNRLPSYPGPGLYRSRFRWAFQSLAPGRLGTPSASGPQLSPSASP